MNIEPVGKPMNVLQKAQEALKQRAKQNPPPKPQDPPQVITAPNGPYTIAGQQVTQPANPFNIDFTRDIKPMGEEIRKLRLAANLSQRDLAFKSNCSQGTITRAENGVDISLFMLIRICGGLGKKITIT